MVLNFWKEAYRYILEEIEGKAILLIIIVGIFFLFGLKLHSGIGTEYNGVFPAIFSFSIGIGAIYMNTSVGLNSDKELFEDLKNILKNETEFKELSRKRLLKYEKITGTQKRAYRVCEALKEHFSDESSKEKVDEIIQIIDGWCSVDMKGWKFR